MIKKIIVVMMLVLCGKTFSLQAQDTLALKPEEDAVAALLASCIETDGDSAKIALANKAANSLQQLLEKQSAFRYSLSGLKNVSTVYSPDKKVRLVTFGVALAEGRYVYHGFVLYNNGTSVTTTRLFAAPKSEADPSRASMQASNWYGAIYYDISMFGSKKAPIYALCGWDGADMFTNRKVLEQLMIDPSGKPKFGGSFASEYGRGFQRLIFEFTEKAVMSLHYNSKEKAIVADHLSAPPQYKGNKQFYGPDMSFDAYYYEKGEWYYEPDIDVKLHQ